VAARSGPLPRGGRRRLAWGSVLCLFLPAASASAQDSPAVGVLAESLEIDSDFRVRVQAALTMGEMDDPAVVPHLIAALEDTHPMVRAAAASSLSVVGNERALRALRALQEIDSVAIQAVRGAIAALEDRLGLGRPYVAPNWATARLYVAVSALSDGSNSGETGLAEELRDLLLRRLRRIDGTMVGEEQDTETGVVANLREHTAVLGVMLTGSVVEWSVVRSPSSWGYRVRLSFVVLDYAEQTVKAMVTGTALSELPQAEVPTARRVELRRAALREAVDAAVTSLIEEMPRWRNAG
jgi:hypothetical protein